MKKNWEWDMSVISFNYLILIVVGIVIYYMIPLKWQWAELLFLSLIFYYLAAAPYTILCIVFSAGVTYISTHLMCREKIKESLVIRRTILMWGGVLNVLPWLVLSARDLWLTPSVLLHQYFDFIPEVKAFPFPAAMGMGYYTCQAIGYMVDCYWESEKAQKNFFKLLLFFIFFPQLTVGPISRYHQLSGLFERHTFSYKNISFGAQRILWGLFKKLVLAERLSTIVSSIWTGMEVYMGFYHWIAVFLYPIQIYSDFSGCMDIVLGTAEMFGISMPENFNNPFFSKSVQEFWQRWHITLGAWAKDYVMYPTLKSSLMVKLRKKTERRFGKRIGRVIPTMLAVGLVWLVMGIWHGGIKHIFGVSLYYWIILMFGELFSPVILYLTKWLQIKVESFSWKLFQCIRTYLIFSLGGIFFVADNTSQAIYFMKSLFSMFISPKTVNPWIFFDESILRLGVTYADINIIIFSVICIVLAAVIKEKNGNVREWIRIQCIGFRWIIWISLFIVIIVYGKYGSGYIPGEFIYQGF